MHNSDDTKSLLTEIRDIQREQLAEYKAMAQRSIQLQEEAVCRQKAIGGWYKRALLITGIILVSILAFLIWFLLTLSSHVNDS